LLQRYTWQDNFKKAFAMSSTYVYLLHHVGGQLFLLGQASDLKTDLGAYSISAFDLSRSHFFAMPNVQSARQLVATLQHAFAHSQEPNHHNSPGKSWLQMACLTRLLSFLGHVKDLMPHEAARHPLQVKDAELRRVRQRWPDEKLKQLQAQHEQSKDSAQREVDRTSQVLARLLEKSTFVAIVRTVKSYVLVGEVEAGSEDHAEEALETLMSSSSGINEYSQWSAQENDAPRCYAAELSYRPGQALADIESYFGWCEHQIWAQQQGVPGLDASLGWQDAKHAASLLASSPGNYLQA
jgi:hypothetical protein